jgi:hypothetical protein
MTAKTAKARKPRKPTKPTRTATSKRQVQDQFTDVQTQLVDLKARTGLLEAFDQRLTNVENQVRDVLNTVATLMEGRHAPEP